MPCRSSGKNFTAEQYYLTALGMSGASTERPFSSSQNCDSSNTTFSNSPASMLLPSSNATAHSPPITVGGSHGGNGSDGGPATSHPFSSTAPWHPGFGPGDKIDNLPPTSGSSGWSSLNTSSTCQRFATDPSTAGQALERDLCLADLDSHAPGSFFQAELVERETDVCATVIEYDEGAAGHENGDFHGGTPGVGKRKTTPQEQNNDVYGTTLACFVGRDHAKLVESDEATAKRFKAAGEGESAKFQAEQSTSNYSEESSPPHSMEDNGRLTRPEQPKQQDFIHVRARRGQATDSHSLAERVRREKISERMKFLQDLIPSCSKITGRAVMLDETINYVQSLQHQVEFLSMKLAAVNPQLDFHFESLLHKEMVQWCASPPTILMDSDQILPHEHPLQAAHQVPFQLPASPRATDFRDLEPGVSEADQRQILSAPLCACMASMDSHGLEPLSQTSNICDGELQSVVQMGFTQGRAGFFAECHQESS